MNTQKQKQILFCSGVFIHQFMNVKRIAQDIWEGGVKSVVFYTLIIVGSIAIMLVVFRIYNAFFNTDAICDTHYWEGYYNGAEAEREGYFVSVNKRMEESRKGECYDDGYGGDVCYHTGEASWEVPPLRKRLCHYTDRIEC